MQAVPQKKQTSSTNQCEHIFTIPSFANTELSTKNAMHLSHSLQSSLDVETVLERFIQGIYNDVPIKGIYYRESINNLQIQLHEKTDYQYACTLTLEKENLGIIQFYLEKPFSDKDIQHIENLILLLIFPLRNALMYQQALRTARLDPLTNIGNRHAYNDTIVREINIVKRHQQSLSVLLLDLDNFKDVNDDYGHMAGDSVLRLVAQTIAEATRDSDMAFRLGGEEFALLLNYTDQEGAVRLAERLRKNIENLICDCEGHNIKITTSIGISNYVDDDTSETLFKRADKALYKAKTGGRNKVLSI